MKTALFFLLLGAVLGAVGWNYYQRANNPTLGQKVGYLADKTKAAAAEARETLSDKASDWRLSAENIKSELASTGQVVRSRARAAGERIDDARIVAVIKGKYVVEKDLSAFSISVDCADGQVSLTGNVTSAESIGRAIALALETGGVHHVVSRLVVRN